MCRPAMPSSIAHNHTRKNGTHRRSVQRLTSVVKVSVDVDRVPTAQSGYRRAIGAASMSLQAIASPVPS